MSFIAVSVIQGESRRLSSPPKRRPHANALFHSQSPAIIVLRICYVYSKNRLARAFVVGTFVASVVSTLVILATIWHDLEAEPVRIPGIKITSCTAPPSKEVWKIFIPNIVLHTVLYLATTVPALRMRRLGKKSMLMNRLVMEYVVFGFCAGPF